MTDATLEAGLVKVGLRIDVQKRLVSYDSFARVTDVGLRLSNNIQLLGMTTCVWTDSRKCDQVNGKLWDGIDNI